MTLARRITTVTLCLFFALTSVSLAVARGAPGPVGLLVICTSTGVQRVAVDADGQPAAPPHICPDCLLGFHGTLPDDPLPKPDPALSTARALFAHATHAAAAPRPGMRARAPPASV